jgi:hypothetical protein
MQTPDPSSTTAAEPLAIPFSEAPKRVGLSRSELYRRAAKGEIIVLKCGRRSLIEYSSLKKLIASLPRAKITTAS